MSDVKPYPCCRVCAFSREGRREGHEVLECRKNPPVCGGTSERTYTAWPIVAGDMWCAAWNRRKADD